MKSSRVRLRWISLGIAVAFIAALALAALAAHSSSAQEESHPAHIHTGTCDQLGDIEFPLSNVGPGIVREGTPSPSTGPVGATSDIYPVDASSTTVNAPLSDLTDGNHAINVHESAENIQNYIACGNIGGEQFANTLLIGLEELNNSGYIGVAVLQENGDQTEVTVYLAEGLAGEEGAAATPTAAAAPATAAAGTSGAAAASAVTIQNFAFSPDSVTIAAGTTVTWTNQDSTDHTVTADDGSFGSDPLSNGQTFSFTFDTPGTYTYHCSIHPNMTGSITVT